MGKDLVDLYSDYLLSSPVQAGGLFGGAHRNGSVRPSRIFPQHWG